MAIVRGQDEGEEYQGQPASVRRRYRWVGGHGSRWSLIQMDEPQENLWARLRARAPGPRGEDCPAEEIWLRVAGGLLPPDEAGDFTSHAAMCDYCGPLLRLAAQDLGAESDLEEELLITTLPSSAPEAQKKIAQRLAEAQAGVAPIKMPRPRARRFPAWSYALAGVAALLTVALVIGKIRSSEAPPERLLAQAYFERRPIEFRFPGAHPAPIRRKRGSGESALDRPAPLINAEIAISRGLAAHPDNPAWMAAKGRADLLEWNSEAALQSFKRALEHSPNSPALLADLAAAHFERAETGHDLDYGAAIDLLGQALQLKPNDPVALFNRAIVDERMYLYEQAVIDWQRYLRIDPSGEWSDEARRNLEEIRKKKGLKVNPVQVPADPAAFLGMLAKRPYPPWARADPAGEDGLDAAVLGWLPALASADSTSARLASSALGRILIDLHDDAWLRDALTSAQSPEAAHGFSELGEAFKLNIAGDPRGAFEHAQSAQRLLLAAGDRAGWARAKLEETYALHRLQEAPRCLQAAGAVSDALRGRAYPWAAAQAALERSVCASMLEDFGRARAYLDEALSIAREAGYPILELRAIGLQAGLENVTGNAAGAWSEDRAGLARFWSGSYPPVRVYQFYADLAFAAEKYNRWRLAASFAREAEAAIARTPNRSMSALAAQRYGTLAAMADLGPEADAAFGRARQAFASLPQDEAVAAYRLDGEVRQAALEAQRGELQRPLERLLSAGSLLRNVKNFTISLRYYQTLGALRLRRGEAEPARAALLSALRIAETGFDSLKSERDRAAWEQQTGQVYRGLVEALLRFDHDPERALRLWEWYRAAMLERRRPSSSDGLELPSPATRRAILADRAVLTYAQLSSGVALWLLDENGLEYHWTEAPENVLNALARRFSEQCADPASDLSTLRRDGRELYRILIGPAEKRLRAGQTLLIETDGAIAGVPFQAFTDPAGGYFGAQHPIAFSLGLARGVPDREIPSWDERARALVVGSPALAPELNSTFPPLPDALREARKVAELFPRSLLLSGSAATPEAILKELPKAQVFHFAGHALAGEDSGLLLAGSEGPLQARRIEEMPLAGCRLAVLSACSTGIGASVTAVNPESLARAFVRAGVARVVATRWSVDSAATTAFVESFYRELRSGSPMPLALNRAASAVRAVPLTSHPYYWSAFTAFLRDSPWTIPDTRKRD
jgi:CHAT domain-containing protein